MAPSGAAGVVTMRKIRGFTLMELLIVMAIIGILAAFAYPSYQNSVIKGNRASAKSFLMEVVQREQQYLLDKRAYADSVSALGLTVPAEVSRYYTVSIALTPGPPPGFTATASPISGKTQQKDGALAITNTGVKTPADKW